MSWKVKRIKGAGWDIEDNEGIHVFIPDGFSGDAEFTTAYLATAERVARELLNILGSNSAIMMREFVATIVAELGAVYEEMPGQELSVEEEKHRVETPQDKG